MTIGTMIKLALALMNVVQWITRRVDQAEWKRVGADEAMAAAAARIAINVGKAETAFTTADKMTNEELDAKLEQGI